MNVSWPDPNDQANQTAFARMLGMSQQAVSKLKANGIIRDGGTFSEWLTAYVERLRSEAAGREQDERLSAARIRQTEMDANLKELEYLRECEKIIYREDLQPALDALVSAIQFNVLAAQDRIIEGIESKYSVQLDDESVSGPLRNALSAVAESAREFVGDGALGAGEPEASDAAADGELGAEVPQAPER